MSDNKWPGCADDCQECKTLTDEQLELERKGLAYPDGYEDSPTFTRLPGLTFCETRQLLEDTERGSGTE